MPQRLLPDLAFSPDHPVRNVFDRDADGFWEQALGDDGHRVNDSDFLRGEGAKETVLSP